MISLAAGLPQRRSNAQENGSARGRLINPPSFGGNVAAQNGEDPGKVLLHAQMLQQLTIPRTKEAANKYLNNANLIKLALMPEKK